MLVCRFPSVFGLDLEVLCAIRVTLHPHEHFSPFLELMVLEDVSPHSGVSFHGGLPLQVMSTHLPHDVLSGWKRAGAVCRNDRRCGKQKQSGEKEVIFHNQNSKTNFPRYSRQDELKNPPNLALERLFCTSRGSK